MTPVRTRVPKKPRKLWVLVGKFFAGFFALVVLLAAGIWIRAWHARRSYYDAAGLPRGPKL